MTNEFEAGDLVIQRAAGIKYQYLCIGREDFGFRSLTDAFDSEMASGQLLFHILGALAQFERSLIRERINAGLQAAKRNELNYRLVQP